MSYTKVKYPASFSVLRADIRKSAIDIANVLIKSGLECSKAEAIALANSREIASFKVETAPTAGTYRTLHVIPFPTGWAIATSDINQLFGFFDTQKEAVSDARNFAKRNKCKLFIHSEKGFVEDCENFMVNKPVTIAKDRLPIPRIKSYL